MKPSDKPRSPDKAVALRYDEHSHRAPQVVASGRGLVAERIVETARQAGVYVHEDPDLAELLAKVPLGEEIPEVLYRSVAEILAFVYGLNEAYRRTHPPEE